MAGEWMQLVDSGSCVGWSGLAGGGTLDAIRCLVAADSLPPTGLAGPGLCFCRQCGGVCVCV